MKSLSKIRSQWKEFYEMPFPEEVAGEDINGICVTSLDTYAAGCISSFASNGALDKNRVKILKSCLEDLDKALPGLVGGPKEYFAALKSLSVEIIKFVK